MLFPLESWRDASSQRGGQPALLALPLPLAALPLAALALAALPPLALVALPPLPLPLTLTVSPPSLSVSDRPECRSAASFEGSAERQERSEDQSGNERHGGWESADQHDARRDLGHKTSHCVPFA